MSSPLQRAHILFEHERYAEAEPELRHALSLEPENPIAHALLAVCLMRLNRSEEAVREAASAIHTGPDNAFGHYAMAMIRDDRDEHPQAVEAIDEALRLQPDNAFFHGIRAGILLQMSRSEESLASAERGLAIDAENDLCGTYRTMALIQLNRTDEALAASGNVLQNNPNSALAHAQTGWTCLHRDKPSQAREHFREALRLDPESDWARDGMLEALKTRSPFYRIMLRYFLWMSRLRSRVQWGIILAIWVVGRGLRAFQEASPGVAIAVQILLGLYIIFLYLTWVAQPLSDATLLFNRDGWLALPRDRRRLAMVVGSGTAAAVTLFLLAQWVPATDLLYLTAIAMLFLCVLSSTAFSTGWTKKPRWLTVLGIGLILATLFSTVAIIVTLPASELLALGTMVAIGIYLIACNIISTRVI
jgi:tetratricopeptide (TPR) repeat protein